MASVKFQKKFTLARSVGSIFITRKKSRLRNGTFERRNFVSKFRCQISNSKISHRVYGELSACDKGIIQSSSYE